MEITQKKAYKMILRHHKRQSRNNPTYKRMKDTRIELFKKTEVCMRYRLITRKT